MFDANRLGNRVVDATQEFLFPFARNSLRQLTAWYGSTAGPALFGLLAGLTGMTLHGAAVVVLAAAGGMLVFTGHGELAVIWARREYFAATVTGSAMALVAYYFGALLWFHAKHYARCVLRTVRASGSLADHVLSLWESEPNPAAAPTPINLSAGGTADPGIPPNAAPRVVEEPAAVLPPSFDLDSVPGPTAATR